MSVTPATGALRAGIDAAMDRAPVGRTHRRIVVAIGLGLFFDMYEIFLSGSISVALGKSFEVSEGQVKLLLASAFIGMFLGAVLLGRLADRLGRRRAFMLTLIWYSVWSLIAAFSPSAWFLVFARFMAGIGVGAEYPVADAYLSDTLPKDHRGRLASWAYTFSFVAVPVVGFLGVWLNEGLVFGVDGWRWLLGLGGVGAFAVLLMRRSLPESPRWLASVGRTDQARRELARFTDEAPDAAAQTPAGEPEVQPRPVAPSTGTSALAGSAGSLSLLRRPLYAKRFSMLVVFHLLQTFGYYGFGTLAALTLVARGQDVTHSLLYTALSFLGYPIGSLLSTPLLKVIERKYLVMGSVVALAVSGFLFATVTPAWLIIVFGFLTTAISNVFSNAYHVYQAEIFPTQLRATAVGWTYSLSRLSSGALPFILLPVLTGHGASAMFLVVSAALAVVVIVVGVLGPRTTRRSLDEINPV